MEYSLLSAFPYNNFSPREVLKPATRLYLFYPLSIADKKKNLPHQAIHREEILAIQKLRTELFIL